MRDEELLELFRADPENGAAALVELSSLSAYLVYFRQRYTLVLQLGGGTFTMLAESLMVLAALVWAAWSLAEALRTERGRP